MPCAHPPALLRIVRTPRAPRPRSVRGPQPRGPRAAVSALALLRAYARQDPPYRMDHEGNVVHPCLVGFEVGSPTHCAGCRVLLRGQVLTGDVHPDAL